jgi:flavoprotein
MQQDATLKGKNHQLLETLKFVFELSTSVLINLWTSIKDNGTHVLTVYQLMGNIKKASDDGHSVALSVVISECVDKNHSSEHYQKHITTEC